MSYSIIPNRRIVETNSKNMMKRVVSLFFIGLAIILSFGNCNSEEHRPSDSKEDDDKEVEYAPFKVMSFNIRHDDDKDPLSLHERKDLILKEITQQNPEIVGLQEYSNNWFEDWMKIKMLDLGYQYYMDESASKGSPKVIFYKEDRFEKRSFATFQMNFTENRSGSWVILYDQENDLKYFVCNSHWTTVSSTERANTAGIVLEEIEQKHQGLPVIAFGDFNAKPHTREMLKMESHKVPAITYADSTFAPTFHGWEDEGKSKIDWIFYSYDNLERIGFRVSNEKINGQWPSDHWAISAEFLPRKNVNE
ncbi:endonuclease/exonuclease/phosphatase family protein [Echinicola shivajiensis]|uniref:endonuclease/exonuclease/phosphatase family protein n=1 Tax=Echinicola shivajiensis TaxID=1035916 RepID=UPI001BFC60AF|nr:endonuclease/exonuclease/phosphatase family protein [Echinicola shivajiensis]